MRNHASIDDMIQIIMRDFPGATRAPTKGGICFPVNRHNARGAMSIIHGHGWEMAENWTASDTGLTWVRIMPRRQCGNCSQWMACGDGLPNLGRCAIAEQHSHEDPMMLFDDYCVDHEYRQPNVKDDLAGANQPSQSKNNADAGSSPSTCWADVQSAGEAP
jgi:hypothetical protein